MKRIEVVAAVIKQDDKIFATQRGYGEFKDGWEFPGGKMEPGETPEEALVREVQEELDTEIIVGQLIDTVEYDYPQFHLTMHCFWCTIASGDLLLKEHEAAAWLSKDELYTVDWLPADVAVLEKIEAGLEAESTLRENSNGSIEDMLDMHGERRDTKMTDEKGSMKDKAKKVAGTVAKGIERGGAYVKDVAVAAVDKTKGAVTLSQQAVIKAIDQDGNGQIDSVDIILLALKTPGVKINRADFLRKELFKNHSSEQIEKAIATTPAQAGITRAEIDRIANEVIKFERNAVSGISAALGVPGGAAMAVTIPVDIAQYYGYMLRAAQKMLYLYGFPELDTSEESIKLDSETINSLTVCLGIMYGVANANNAIKAIAKALAVGVEKKLLKAALTKGAIYPFVRSIAKWFGIRMTKSIFAGFFKKAIPVVGGVVGGGITFASFKPCCYRLKDALKDTMLSNPNHQSTQEENEIFEDIMQGVIDVEVIEGKAIETEHDGEE